jgi:hypothetical protein
MQSGVVEVSTVACDGRCISSVGKPGVWRMWSLELGSCSAWERASSRLDLAPSESRLLRCQKFYSRSYICALLELEFTSWGPEVASSVLKFPVIGS